MTYKERNLIACRKYRSNHVEKEKKRHKRDNNTTRFGGLREIVIQRDNQCLHCGSVENLSVDHIDGNRSNNILQNLQTLCFPCHGHKDGIRGWKWIDNKAIRISK
jgi:5-methylcytosine-specific restriction endonuclease McrA